ncbi:MAG TPA: hypothetical protein VGM94_01160 [Galbitalea sp.]|jgi:predicted RNA-binding Zn-ribbon protein involved in translation (DUF1610 family)
MPRPLPGKPQQLPPVTQGPIHRVPCPHCGQPEDFRALNDQQLLDTGHQVVCEHCGYSMEVVGIQDVKVVSVRKDPRTHGRPRDPNPPAQPARTVGAGMVNRLLGRGRR